MSLLKQKKENDRIAAEAAAKAKEEAILRDLTVHPVIKMGCSREVRDAYLYGIVVAAIANDDKIDSDEQSILDHIANSMEIPAADVEETITRVNQMSVDEKLQLLEESVGAFKDRSNVVKFFYAQFAELWFTGEHNLVELKEIAGMLEGWSGVEFPTERFKDIKAVVSNASTLNSSLDDLTAWLGDDMLLRFAVGRYGDVTLRLELSRKEKQDAAVAAEKKRKAEEKERKKREMVNGFFDMVSKEIVELGLGKLTSISYAEATTFQEHLIQLGCHGLDALAVYQSVYESLVTKDEAIEKDYCHEISELKKREGKGRCSLFGVSDEERNCWKKRDERREKLYLQMCWAVLGLAAVVGRISSEDVSKFNGLIRKARGEAKGICAGNANSRTVFWFSEVEKRVGKIFGLKPVWEDGEE